MIRKLFKMLWMLAILLFATDSARATDGRWSSRLRSNCTQQCDPRDCPPTPQCKHSLVKDRCGCCLTCPRQLSHPLLPTTPCADVVCYNRKICIVNLQGLPLCKCPSDDICANAPREPTCGSDRILYYSKCLKRVQECRKGKKINDVPRKECTMRQQRKGKIQPIRVGEEKNVKNQRREARKLSRRHRKKVLEMTRDAIDKRQTEKEENKTNNKSKSKRNRRRNKNRRSSKKQLLRRLRKAQKKLKRYQKRVRAAKSRQRRKAINFSA